MDQHGKTTGMGGRRTIANLTTLTSQANQFAELVRGGRNVGEIGACPGWTEVELVDHLGTIYRWVTMIVAQRRLVAPSAAERDALRDPNPTDRPGSVERFIRSRDALLRTLRAAPSTLRCWTTWPASSARQFWIRRMIHETVVHRVDLEFAGRSTIDGSHLPSHLASDGIDEMLYGFATRYKNTLRASKPVLLAMFDINAGQSWTIRLSPGEPVLGRGESPAADTEVYAGSGDLLLLLWNRRTVAGLDTRGNGELWRLWSSGAHL